MKNFIYLDFKLTFCTYKYNFNKDKALKTKALKTALDKHAFATVLFKCNVISFNKISALPNVSIGIFIINSLLCHKHLIVLKKRNNVREFVIFR